MSLLEVRDLSVAFRVGSKELTAVQEVSFELGSRQSLALVGESGAGKSVSALSIPQLLPYPAAFHPSGSIRFHGQEIMGASSYVMRQLRGGRIGMIFQEPSSSLNPLHPIGRQIEETLILHKNLSTKAARARCLELLHLVALPEQRWQALPHELSGGQCQRVMIAIAIANEPELLIADEPTTALDVTIQAQILALLTQLQQRFGTALLLITHDLQVVRKMAERACIMRRGRIVEQGEVSELFTHPRCDYTRELLAAEAWRGGISPCEVSLDEVSPQAQHATRVNPEESPVIAAECLRVHFPIRQGIFGRKTQCVKAVDGVDLKISPGQTLGVVGESGSGKTTLGMALLRLNHSTGCIRLAGDDIQSRSSRQLRPIRRQMQIVFQDPYSSLSPRLSVGEIIGEGLAIHHRNGRPGSHCPGSRYLGSGKNEHESMVAAALEEVGLSADMLQRYPHELSGGQRQRVSIARAVILKPWLVVLDEPTSALDMSVQSQIIELLCDLQRRHRLAYLFISHDLQVVRAMAHELIVMKDGQVVERGSTSEIFSEPRHPYTKALLAAALHLDIANPHVVRS